MKFLLNSVIPLLAVVLLAVLAVPEIVRAGEKQNGSQEVHAINQQAGKVSIRKDEGDISKPVHIEADRMFSDQRDNVVIFTGNVVAVQGTLTINSEKMTVYHEAGSGKSRSEAESGGDQQIDRIVAEGEVQVNRDDLTAAGDKVIFEIRQEKIFITGNARVWHQDNLVKGEKVVFDLSEGTTVFESGGQEGRRVKAFFYPEEE